MQLGYTFRVGEPSTVPRSRPHAGAARAHAAAARGTDADGYARPYAMQVAGAIMKRRLVLPRYIYVVAAVCVCVAASTAAVARPTTPSADRRRQQQHVEAHFCPPTPTAATPPALRLGLTTFKLQ